MSFFTIRYPLFILMACMIVVVIGVAAITSMPVDLFPPVNIPVVVVATFYAGMPPEQIESDITDSDVRFFTLGSNIDHIKSRSMSGVSLIKIYFQPGTDPTAAVSGISNLAMANLRRLPPGTLPPVVLSFDAANLQVCLITLKGAGMNQTELKDVAQFTVRNQVANVPGASVPQPYGGTYRQIMIYVDPLKLEASQLGVMDVVHAVNDSNLILPAGDVRIGPKDYNIYANSQVPTPDDVNSIPLKTVGNASILVGDVGHAVDGGQLQTNIVRVDGQHSVYIPVLKQGGDSNTITIVNGTRKATAHLLDIPQQLKTSVVFDQSVFVKTAIKNVISEGSIGLCLTGVMILLFLGNVRATVAVLLSIPISCIATFLILKAFGDSINTMVLGGMALVLSRLIDNSVVVLENIFRHFEMGSDPVKASQEGGILLAIPPGIFCVILFLLVTGTTINIMSLMGVLMMTGIVVSDSILIVEFTGQLREQGLKLEEAIITACKVRLRPILMTTLATVLGLIPMALAIEAGSEQYAPLARAILGGLTVSGVVTVFLVPSAYLLIHRRIEARREHADNASFGDASQAGEVIA
jgi:multidrug efflux pump subunit AcrB